MQREVYFVVWPIKTTLRTGSFSDRYLLESALFLSRIHSQL